MWDFSRKCTSNKNLNCLIYLNISVIIQQYKKMDGDSQSLSFVKLVTKTINYERDQIELIEKAKIMSNGDPLDTLKYIVTSLTHDNANIEFELVLAIPCEMTITLPIIVSNGELGFGYYVSWGDGITTHNTSTHTYKKPQHIMLYNIRIFGFCISGFGCRPYDMLNKIGHDNDFEKTLLQVISFGNLGHKFVSLYGAFMNCTKLTDVPKDIPSSITDVGCMFARCKYFNCLIDTWDTSNITNMAEMFMDCANFNQPLNSWNTNSVTDMGCMFFGCSTFNQSLDSWNTSSVTNMNSMFSRCTSFNGSIGAWNVRNVNDMSLMFRGCTSFNKPIGAWNVPYVKDISLMFYGCGISYDNMVTFKM